jgi:hypothetical protein
MTWLLIFAGLVVLLVGGAVLPRRAEYRGGTDSPGFPWFWVTFPVAVLGLVSTLGMILGEYTSTIYTSRDDLVGLSMPYPVTGEIPGLEFLSTQQFRQMFGPLPYAVYVWFFPVLGVVFTIASVVAVRKGRM